MAKKKGSALGKQRHHKKNPGFIGDSISTNVKQIVGAALGFLGDVYIPAFLLGMVNQADSGPFAYLAAAATVLAPAWAAHKFGMPNLAKGWLLGSGAGFAWRIVDDVTGQKLVEVQVQTPEGMSSFFIPQNSVLPGPNVFGAYGRRSMAAGAGPSPVTATGAGKSTSVMSISKPASGMGWARYPYAA